MLSRPGDRQIAALSRGRGRGGALGGAEQGWVGCWAPRLCAASPDALTGLSAPGGGSGRACVDLGEGSPRARGTRARSRPHAVKHPVCSLGARGVPIAVGPETALQSGPAGASTSAGRELRTASLPPCAVKADGGGPGQGREAPWHSLASRGQEVALWLSPEGRMSRSYRRRWRRTAEAPHTGLAGHRKAHSAQGQRGPRPEVGGEPSTSTYLAERPSGRSAKTLSPPQGCGTCRFVAD